jgi:hypothetical protein
MRNGIRAAVVLALLMSMAAAPTVSALSDAKRDKVIAKYYEQNPRDHDYYRWKKGRRNWSDQDYLRWYQARTRDFQAGPGIAALFGVDETGDKVPGFTVQ